MTDLEQKPSSHFHLLSRVGGHLSGDIRRLSARDVMAAVDGTAYSKHPELRAVADGKAARGYVTVPASTDWVAATRCESTTTEQCREQLVTVTVFGDLRSGFIKP